MISDFEYFNDEWNEDEFKEGNSILPRVEGSIEGTTPSQE